MNIRITHRGRTKLFSVRRMGPVSMYRGLMFRSRTTDNLLFDYPDDSRRPIHSWFVFFSFLVVWLDKRNRVVEMELVRPFRCCVQPKKKYRRFVELPLNTQNDGKIRFFVGKIRKV